MIDAVLLLPKILARVRDNRELAEAAAKIAWTRAAGEGLRQHALPLGLEQHNLIVAVADSVWQKQLRSMSAELIFRVNKLLQSKVVETIEFRINPGALRASGSARKSMRAEKRAQPLPPNVISSAAEIDDPELRERFLRAAKNCIERRENPATNKSAIRNPNSAT